jgi:small multidrug resistance pump|tara:strand:- start:100 stop:417 length:318 start_codon:yes stop_codon:yes gene_type:complete
MSYLYLIGAIVFEVVGTMLLPLSKNFTKPLISIILIASYVLSFYFLTYALKDIPIAVVYSTWAGVGIFLITFLGYIFYSQSLQWQSIVGLIFIAIGVAIVNIFKG